MTLPPLNSRALVPTLHESFKNKTWHLKDRFVAFRVLLHALSQFMRYQVVALSKSISHTEFLYKNMYLMGRNAPSSLLLPSSERRTDSQFMAHQIKPPFESPSK